VLYKWLLQIVLGSSPFAVCSTPLHSNTQVFRNYVDSWNITTWRVVSMSSLLLCLWRSQYCGVRQRSTVGGDWSSVTAYSCFFTSFPLWITCHLSCTQLFHTGQPNGCRGSLPLLQQRRWLLPVEELVKLHFSVKASFFFTKLLLCCVFPVDLKHKGARTYLFIFPESIIILYNNSSGKKESRLAVLSHHQGLQLKCQSPSKKRTDLKEPDSGL